MTVFDYVVIGIVGISVLLSLFRGLIREIFGLASWVLAAFAAKAYGVEMATLLPETIATQSLRLIAGFVIVFICVLLLTNLLAITLNELFKLVGLGWLNRFFGSFFGLARGLLIVGVLVLLGGMTALPQDPRWQNAMLSEPLETMVIFVKLWLPKEIANRINYDQQTDVNKIEDTVDYNIDASKV